MLEALRSLDLSDVRIFCDVAGGHGYLMSALLRAYPHLSGIVLDLPEVVSDQGELSAAKFGVQDRCRYVGGDMFKQIPQADAYSLKMILHDWNDAECVEILSNVRRSARPGGGVFIVEHIVPGHDEPHFGKLFDIHMMCWGTGRERTEAEYVGLLEKAGWRHAGSHYPSSRMMGLIEGTVNASKRGRMNHPIRDDPIALTEGIGTHSPFAALHKSGSYRRLICRALAVAGR